MTRLAIRLAVAGVAAVAGLVVVALMLLVVYAAPPQRPSVSLAGADPVSCAVAAPTGGLDAAKVAAIAYKAGFRDDDIDIAVAVSRAESGWNPLNTNKNRNGSTDYGLFQINTVNAAILADGNWRDPQENAVMAFKIWTDWGGKWGAWVTYWDGSYRKYLQPIDVTPVCSTPIATACAAPKDLSQYGNGMIPIADLCPLWADPRHHLRSDAAGAFNALAKAYTEAFGSKPCITDSYRSYAEQVDVYRRKPGLAAKPGTSNHGWGLALDLGCGLQIAGSAQDRWMHANAPKFGWVHPPWAEPGGSRPEPWHWGFPDGVHRP